MRTHDLHPTEIEIIAEAHHHLTSAGAAFPQSGAKSDLDEIYHEAENVPRTVIDARDALDDGHADRAESLLEDFLSGTEYDPNDPDSHHPSN